MATELLWHEVATRFQTAPSWWVATQGPEGPHAVPVWGVVVDDALFIKGKKGLANLDAHPDIEVRIFNPWASKGIGRRRRRRSSISSPSPRAVSLPRSRTPAAASPSLRAS